MKCTEDSEGISKNKTVKRAQGPLTNGIFMHCFYESL